MFMRIDKLQIDLPAPQRPDPNAAAALQELLGGKYGEMSTLGNYLFQSFNFRSKNKLRPFYSLVAAITAEELGHVELVSNGVAMLNNGPDNKGDSGDGGDISGAPFEDMKDIRLWWRRNANQQQRGTMEQRFCDYNWQRGNRSTA
jgi:Mn-containing catalase